MGQKKTNDYYLSTISRDIIWKMLFVIQNGACKFMSRTNNGIPIHSLFKSLYYLTLEV